MPDDLDVILEADAMLAATRLRGIDSMRMNAPGAISEREGRPRSFRRARSTFRSDRAGSEPGRAA
jgi:hypothetical protein